jgi:hypothetical protein
MSKNLSDDELPSLLSRSIQGANGAALATARNLQSAIVHAYELERANNVVQSLESADGIEIATDQRYRLMKQFRLVP